MSQSIKIETDIDQANQFLNGFKNLTSDASKSCNQATIILQNKSKKLPKQKVKNFIEALNNLNLPYNRIFLNNTDTTQQTKLGNQTFKTFIKAIVKSASESSCWETDFANNKIKDEGGIYFAKHMHEFKGRRWFINLTANPLTEKSLEQISIEAKKSLTLSIAAINNIKDDCPFVKSINTSRAINDGLYSLMKDVHDNKKIIRNPSGYINDELTEIICKKIISKIPNSPNQEKKAAIITKIKQNIAIKNRDTCIKNWNETIDYYGSWRALIKDEKIKEIKEIEEIEKYISNLKQKLIGLPSYSRKETCYQPTDNSSSSLNIEKITEKIYKEIFPNTSESNPILSTINASKLTSSSSIIKPLDQLQLNSDHFTTNPSLKMPSISEEPNTTPLNQLQPTLHDFITNPFLNTPSTSKKPDTTPLNQLQPTLRDFITNPFLNTPSTSKQPELTSSLNKPFKTVVDNIVETSNLSNSWSLKKWKEEEEEKQKKKIAELRTV